MPKYQIEPAFVGQMDEQTDGEKNNLVTIGSKDGWLWVVKLWGSCQSVCSPSFDHVLVKEMMMPLVKRVMMLLSINWRETS